MATYTISQYQRVWRKRASAIRKSGERTSNDAAMFMKATATGMAPSKTGKLRRGITKRKQKEGSYIVSSVVPGDFPYNLWVNQMAPFRTIKSVWNGRQPTVYGDGSHRITGTPRFWHFATLRTRNMFPKLAKKNFDNALRLSV